MEVPLVQPLEPPATANDPVEASWKRLYRIAGVAALLIFAVAFTDIAISFVHPEASAPGGKGAADWLAALRDSRWLSLRDLGVLNLANQVLGLPVYLALFGAHRRTEPATAAFAGVLFALGAAVYLSTNKVLGLDQLALQYAGAASEADKARWVAAADAALAIGEDLTAGTFMGFLLTEIALLTVSLTMLRGRVFARWAGWLGVVASVGLLGFNVSAAFLPSIYRIGLGLAAVGGLAAMAWYVLVARRLFQLARSQP